MSDLERPASSSDEDITTFVEDFEAMRAVLVTLGAGERAISGTVANEDGAAFRAGYRVIGSPPRIIQVALAASSPDYSVTCLGVNAQDDPDGEPNVRMSRRTADITDDAALLADLHAAGINEARMVELGAEPSDLVFDQLYYNITDDFSPDL